MARYVLLEFKDNTEADRIVERYGDSVLGVYMRPTQFCECAGIPETWMGKLYAIGRKYGLLVHKGCGKPPRLMWQRPRNLLRPDGEQPNSRVESIMVWPRQHLPKL